MKSDHHDAPWRRQLYHIIFLNDSRAGRLFDLLLICAILLSMAAVMLESISGFDPDVYRVLLYIEWSLTFLFTIEYFARIVSLRHPKGYLFSFFGVVDLLALLPTYLALVMAGSQYLIVIRGLRLIRVFRVLKLFRFMGEANQLKNAMLTSMPKIIVFLITIVNVAIIAGTLLYLVEGEKSGYTSIPKSVYWAIVTMTTVGYGDISPATPLGQAIASVLMIMGYAILAVPTGIVSVELAQAKTRQLSLHDCPSCHTSNHDLDAVYCKFCGNELNPVIDEQSIQSTSFHSSP